MNLLWRPTSRALGRQKYNANTRISRCRSVISAQFVSFFERLHFTRYHTQASPADCIGLVCISVILFVRSCVHCRCDRGTGFRIHLFELNAIYSTKQSHVIDSISCLHISRCIFPRSFLHACVSLFLY